MSFNSVGSDQHDGQPDKNKDQSYELTKPIRSARIRALLKTPRTGIRSVPIEATLVGEG